MTGFVGVLIRVVLWTVLVVVRVKVVIRCGLFWAALVWVLNGFPVFGGLVLTVCDGRSRIVRLMMSC